MAHAMMRLDAAAALAANNAAKGDTDGLTILVATRYETCIVHEPVKAVAIHSVALMATRVTESPKRVLSA